MSEPQTKMNNQFVLMMSRLFYPQTLRCLLGTGLFLLAAPFSRADTLVTFSVDMNSQPNAIIDGSTVYVRGSFNDQNFGLDALNILTNDGFGVYSGTVNITNAPGTVIACKFYFNNPGDNWETGADRQFLLEATAQVLPATSWDAKYPAPDNNITFQIDMTQQVALGNFDPLSGYVRVSGGFNGWSESADFTNNPAASGAETNIYSQTLVIAGFPGGQPGNYKFRSPIGDTWETISDRPSFTLIGGDQTLPLVYWNNVSPFTPTNNVTFQVDMTTQIFLGNWTPGQPIRVAGSMTGWGDGADLTNNPALVGDVTNIYSGVLPVVAFPGDNVEYKFRANNGWESPASTAGNNRSFQVAGGDQILPLVLYDDASLCDLLTQPTTVTYVLHLTNGTVATDGTVFDGSQTVNINGEFNGWQPWDPLLPQMTPAGGDLYEFTTVLPSGAARAQKFKFSIGGADNEAPAYQDHIQYVRTAGSSYSMPVAEFGTNYASVRVESAFGNLTISAPVGGYIPLSWLGLPCVTLQTRTDLSSGDWTDLPATDATSSTNWPNAGDAYFRLQKRTIP